MNPRSFARRFFRRTFSNPMSALAFLFIVVLLAVAIFGPEIAPYDPLRPNFRRIAQPPSVEHWFGTAQNGRDILSRVIHGARISVTIGVAAVLLGLAAGTTVGLMTGYFGGRLDAVLMRGVDVLLAFPGILLAILIISIFGSSVANIIIALAVFSIPTFARVSRGSALTLRTLEYVQAGRALGGSSLRMLVRHVLPKALAPVVVYGTLRSPTAILGGASLSFPGLAIFLPVLSVNLLGDVLRDVLDPKMRA